MSCLAIAYPEISEKDLSWIQDYRSKYDKKFYSIIKPHFTFVFAIEDFEPQTFITEVKEKIADTKQIVFNLKAATINKDISGTYYHEFLVPDEGQSSIIKLHDKLYSGLFKKYWRQDIDFIPHIGIGNSESVEICRERANELNEQNFTVEGIIDFVDIIEYKGSSIGTLERVKLI